MMKSGNRSSKDAKSKVLQEKERRKIAAQVRREEELQRIRDNVIKEKERTKNRYQAH